MTGPKYLWAALAVLMALPVGVLAQDQATGGVKWFQLNNRLRIEHDDNVDLAPSNEQDSFKVIEELELFFDFNLDQTFASLRYRPSYIYWDDRESDKSDLNHDIDFIFRHEFTPRVTLNVRNLFRVGEQPELIDRGTTFRENNDFIYNHANGSLSFLVAPDTHLNLAGTYVVLRYDETGPAQLDDYDIYVVGADLGKRVLPETTLQGQVRYETIEYDANNRGSDGVQVGGALAQKFSPNLTGRGRAGWEHKTYDDDGIDNSDSPYVDASLTLLPSPATRISAGVGYSKSETDVFPFASQDRLQLFGSIAHDLSARLALYLASNYIMNDLAAEDALSTEATPVDGNEDIFQLSARLAYRLNRSNTLEAGWQLTDLSSDVREEYLRNRISVGWKAELF